jgi:hypothetical protein
VGQYAPKPVAEALPPTSALQAEAKAEEYRASGEPPASTLERLHEIEDFTYVALDELAQLEGWDEATAADIGAVIGDTFGQMEAILVGDTPPFPGDPTADDILKGLYQELRPLIGAEGIQTLITRRDQLLRERRGLPAVVPGNDER